MNTESVSKTKLCYTLYEYATGSKSYWELQPLIIYLASLDVQIWTHFGIVVCC